MPSSSSSSSLQNSSQQSPLSSSSHGKLRSVPLSPLENLAVGAAGGAFETCLQMPLTTYKLCQQEGRALPSTMRGWYRGVAVQAGTVAPITALQFMVNGMLQHFIVMSMSSKQKDHHHYPLSDAQIVLTAAGAGAVSAVVYGPVDLLTIQQQKLQSPLLLTLRHILTNFGTAGLFRGLASCAVREAIYTAGYLGLAPVASEHLKVHYYYNNPWMADVTGACLAGAAAALVTHPVDTCKTMVQADLAGTQYPTARSVKRDILSNKGMRYFFKGVVPRTTRICGAFFVCMSLRNVATEYKTRQRSIYSGD